MARPRFSIAGLMITVLVIALGFAALRDPRSEVWASLIFTFAVIVLLTATLGSLIHRRASWIGFAMFGWAGLFLAFGPLRPSDATPIPTPLTTMLLKEMSARLYDNSMMPAGSSAIGYQVYTDTAATIGGKSVMVPYTLLQTGNSLFSLVAAGAGGVIARILIARRDAPGETA
jgi:hypothetical protein